MTVADACRHSPRAVGWRSGNPVDARGRQLAASQFLAWADDQAALGRIEAQHVHRDRSGESEPLPLADRVPMQSAVATDDRAGRIDDLAFELSTVDAEPALDEAARIAVGDEADFMAVGLVGHRQAEPRRHGANVGPRPMADR